VAYSKPVPATFSNETMSLSIDCVELIDEIIGFELDENYVYVDDISYIDIVREIDEGIGRRRIRGINK
jgi:hypothetical protein